MIDSTDTPAAPSPPPDAHRSIGAFVARELRSGKHPNRLVSEKSPYLLQHAFNPVDWHPWGDEAFERARKANKPIFLSIGYSTCYWCHVMERQVFENPDIAALMNELVVCIKVDREERPDVDRIYMAAVQAMTGSGGWPMSVFLTPDLKPFYGGTYIPPVAAHGRPGFPELLKRIDEIWRTEPSRILESGNRMAELLHSIGSAGSRGARGAQEPETALAPVRQALDLYSSAYDEKWGGFGTGTKFPRPAVLTFLFCAHHRLGDPRAAGMALHTLREMADGGMFDHLGGGFHRYSVDSQWRVPHFEKMLYDQAQLCVSYLEAFQISGETTFRDTARAILRYVSSELRDPLGGFYSAEDAESAHEPGGRKEEGTFYVWTLKEVLDLLGDRDGRLFAFRYGVVESGNALEDPMRVFVRKNILYAARTVEEAAKAFDLPLEDAASRLDGARSTLLAARSRRPRPHLDDKIIAAWNGLMISAYAKAFRVLGDREYLSIAAAAARFLFDRMTEPGSGRLYRRYRDGEARFEGGLQDYAFVVQGLLDLYEASFDEALLRRAVEMTALQVELFAAPGGGFFDTPAGDASLIVRSREEYDGAEPAGNTVATINLYRLARMTDDVRWKEFADGTVTSALRGIAGRPDVAPLLLAASLWTSADPTEIVVAGELSDERTRALLAEIGRRYLPYSVTLHRPAELAPGSPLPAFVGAPEYHHPEPRAFVCRNYACRLPTGDPEVLGGLLDDEAAPVKSG